MNVFGKVFDVPGSSRMDGLLEEALHISAPRVVTMLGKEGYST